MNGLTSPHPPIHYRFDDRLQKLRSRHGMLWLNGGMRIAILLILTYYFRRYHAGTEIGAAVDTPLVLFWLYNIAAGLVAFIRHDFLLRPWVKLGQSLIEISFYTGFFFLNGQVGSELFFLYCAPLFIGIRFLDWPKVLAVIVYNLAAMWLAMWIIHDPSPAGMEIFRWNLLMRSAELIGLAIMMALKLPGSIQGEISGDTTPIASLLGSLSDGVFILDEHGAIVYANDVIQETHGALRPGLKPQEYLHCRSSVFNWDELKETGSTRPVEVEMGDQLGNRYKARLSLTATRGEGSQVREVIGNLRKLDDRVQHELLQKLQQWNQANQTRQETYYELGKKLTSPQTPAAVMKLLVDEARARLKAEHVALFLQDEDGRLVIQASSGIELQHLQGECYAPGQGVTGQILPEKGQGEFGKPVRINRLEDQEQLVTETYQRYVRLLPGGQACHLLGVPLNGQKGTFGALRALNRLDASGRPHAQGFSQEDEEFLAAIGAMSAVAIENARLIADKERLLSEIEQRLKVERQRSEQLNALYHFSVIFHENLPERVLIRRVIEKIRDVVPFTSISIQELRDDEFHVLDCDGFGRHNQQVRRLVFPVDAPKYPNYQVYLSKAPVILPDVMKEDAYQHFSEEQKKYHSERIRSWMGIPLIGHQQVIGMIAFDHEQPDFYSEETKALAVTAANAIANEIERSRQFKHVSDQRRTLRGLNDKLEAQTRTRARLVEASSKLLRLVEFKDLLHMVEKEAQAIFEAHSCTLYLADEQGETLQRTHPGGEDESAPVAIDEKSALGRIALGCERPEVSSCPLDHLGEGHGAARRRGPGCQVMRMILEDSHKHCLGVLELESGPDRPAPFSEFDKDIFMTFCMQVGTTMERARLTAKYGDKARKEERRLLSQDLHYVQGNVQTKILWSAIKASSHLKAEEDELVQGNLEMINKSAVNVWNSLYRITNDLRDDGELRTHGLLSELKKLAEASSIPIEEITSGRVPLPPIVEYSLYKIGAEALNNIQRHADCAPTSIRLKTDGDYFVFQISDRGRGFDAAVARASKYAMGLSDIDYWATQIGATANYYRNAQGGNVVEIRGSISFPGDVE